MSELALQTRRLARRLALAVFLREACRWGLVGALLAGAGILIQRAFFEPDPGAGLPWLGLPALAPAIAFWSARRRLPSRSSLTVFFDLQSGGSGALLAAAERGDARWQETAERALERAVAHTHLAYEPGGWRLAVGLLFCALALWVPVAEGEPPLARTWEQAAVERVREKLETLEEEVRLESELVDAWHERLDRLEEEEAERSTESTFETLDRLEDRLEAEAERAHSALQEVRANLQHAALEAERAGEDSAAVLGAELARSLDELGQTGLAPHLPEELRAALEELAAALAEEAARADDGESGGAGDLEGSLSASELGRLGELGELAQLARLARELDSFSAERARSLLQSGLLDASRLGDASELLGAELARAALQELSTTPLEELVREPHECDENCPPPGSCPKHAPGSCQGAGCPGGACPYAGGAAAGRAAGKAGSAPGTGSGDITRGPGSDARLWGATSPELEGALQAKVLPEALFKDLEHSRLLAVGATRPEVAPEGGAGGSAAVETSLGRASWQRRLAPRHRRAVQGFFGGSDEERP